MITIYELTKTFNDAFAVSNSTEDGIRAVVESLRSNYPGDDWIDGTLDGYLKKILEDKHPGETCEWKPSGREYFVWETACQHMLGKEHNALQTGICLCGRAALIPEATP